MLSLLAAILLTAAAPVPGPTMPTPEFRILGYLPDYRAAAFDPRMAKPLTDLIVFSAEPMADGSLDLSRLKEMPWDRLHTLKAQEKLRLILCVGGWQRSAHFAAVAGSPASRRQFAESALRACQEKSFDGLDLDWEHPANAIEEEAYADLLEELHRVFQPCGLSVSVTLAAWQKLPPRAIAAADRIQVMAYDHAGRHATLESAKQDVETLRKKGVPREKLVLGLPFYGRQLADRNQASAYREIAAKYRPKPEADEAEGIYFNGPATIRRKTEFARDTGLAGVMVWEITQDAPGDQALLKTIRETATPPAPQSPHPAGGTDANRERKDAP